MSEPAEDERARLDRAVKAQDGFFTTFFVSPYSKYIARWCARRGLTPNQVTVASVLLGVAAAGAFARGTRPALVAGAVLVQAAFTADCVDGQLARYTQTFSPLGAWMDAVFDRAKEYLMYAGLAVGTIAAGAEPQMIWLLATTAMLVQTARHAADFSFAAQQHTPAAIAEDDVAPRPLGAAADAARRVSRASEHGPAVWLKRMIILPIGERFALISVTAALFDGRVTFVALLAWAAVAVVYASAGRVLRSVA